jgi:hypothetical protein
MPAKSKAQFRFMKMMEHNPEMTKDGDISPAKAKEFTKENVGKKAYKKLPEFKKLKKLVKGDK